MARSTLAPPSGAARARPPALSRGARPGSASTRSQDDYGEAVSVGDLTELQRLLLECITDDAEPTWILLKENSAFGGDREAVTRAFQSLRARGLVEHERMVSGDPSATDLSKEDDWWRLTRAGWQLLGETPPSTYDAGGPPPETSH